MYLALQFIICLWKQIHFLLYFNKNTFLSNFTICLYNGNTFLIICRKSKIIPVAKISIWHCRKDKNKNKNRMRTSLFQSSEDGKQEIFLCCLTYFGGFQNIAVLARDIPGSFLRVHISNIHHFEIANCFKWILIKRWIVIVK